MAQTKYLDDAMQLLDTLRVEYKTVGISYYDSISKLKEKQSHFPQFNKAIEYDMFRKAFGWQICKFDDYFFMVKKTAKQTIFIEVELK